MFGEMVSCPRITGQHVLADQIPAEGETTLDPSLVRSALVADAESLGRAELEEALAKLDGQGELTDAQRAVIRDLATTLVHALVAPPATALRDQADPDQQTIETIRRLYDRQVDPSSAGDPHPAREGEHGDQRDGSAR